jgi:hypothetical protein
VLKEAENKEVFETSKCKESEDHTMSYNSTSKEAKSKA